MACAVLMVPGFTGSGLGHWQSIWEREHPEYRRVQQRDWDHPEPTEWLAVLDRAVRGLSDRVLLVGFSLGCIAIAKWAVGGKPGKVVGAMLVAPCDVEADAAPPELRCFAPIPLERLPFDSLAVTSSNDPLVSPERAAQFAQAWGSRLVSIGAAGHIHTAAGYGPWPEGHALLREMLSHQERTA